MYSIPLDPIGTARPTKTPKVAMVLAGIYAALQFGAGARGPGERGPVPPRFQRRFQRGAGKWSLWIGLRDPKQGEKP